jgi:hypothetical protein
MTLTKKKKLSQINLNRSRIQPDIDSYTNTRIVSKCISLLFSIWHYTRTYKKNMVEFPNLNHLSGLFYLCYSIRNANDRLDRHLHHEITNSKSTDGGAWLRHPL